MYSSSGHFPLFAQKKNICRVVRGGGLSHLSELLCEPVDLGAAPVVLLEGAAGERAGRAAAHEAEPVQEQRLAELLAAERPEFGDGGGGRGAAAAAFELV